eukprot:1230691-Amphidinium_carterae.3
MGSAMWLVEKGAQNSAQHRRALDELPPSVGKATVQLSKARCLRDTLSFCDMHAYMQILQRFGDMSSALQVTVKPWARIRLQTGEARLS